VLLDALRRLWAVVLGEDVPAPGPSPEGSAALPADGGSRRRTRRPTLDDVIAASPEIRAKLRERARSSGAVIVSSAALIVAAWWVVDRLLEPALATRFLQVRLLGEVPILVVVWLLCGTRLGHRRPELLTWLALGVIQVEVAWMLPQVTHVEYYLMGFTLAIYACGCLLESRPRWTVLLIGTSWAALAVATLLDSTPEPVGTLGDRHRRPPAQAPAQRPRADEPGPAGA
jgi:hypothetical protein